VCWRHPHPVITRAPFNSLLVILLRLRGFCNVPGRDSLSMGCSGSPRLGIGGVLDPFAHFSCHTCGSPFRIFSSDTPSAYGRLLFVPFISLEPLLLLANSAFLTISAPYDRPYLIPQPSSSSSGVSPAKCISGMKKISVYAAPVNATLSPMSFSSSPNVTHFLNKALLQPMHVNTNHLGALHLLRLQPLCAGLRASCSWIGCECNWSSDGNPLETGAGAVL
jgi:hypothetical protein